MNIQVANLVPVTEAEGPGRRFALWLQGCPLRCPSCCNPEMLSFSGGTKMSMDELMRMITQSHQEHQIEGITLLGGEPFAHAELASELAAQTQLAGLSVMVFSGFTMDELREQQDSHVDRLIDHTDILVDGPYDKTQPDSSRRWIGSLNQRIHFLTNKYQAEDACWKEPDTLEIRIENGELSVNGFPAKQAVGVWKRPKNKPIGDKSAT
ncbi:MAG: 4Fe-4S single cluster domain-containing protein [Rubripirellula sp.]